LPAYVQKVRDDGKLDVELRSFGGKQKSLEVSELIIDYLECSEDGVLNVGDKSSPEDINTEFPGVSKTVSTGNSEGFDESVFVGVGP
jgi:predicted RNA-binding protein (virulence factor B family)